MELTETRIGQMYRCKITDSYGNVVYSDPCSINFASDTWEFTYNADGLRTSRTDGYTTYNYVYHGGQLSQMTVGDEVLRFGYDANGAPLYVIWNVSKYFYTTNLQGDVVAIVSANGNPVVEYTYDAWGNILSITGSRADNLGKYNPLRYRGYVYDIETELYYLQSRYYDPEWGRFLNADGYVSTGQGLLGNNMFAYCRNNPVRRVDITGKVDADCYDDDPIDEEDILNIRDGGGENGTTSSSAVTVYRAMSAEEYHNTMSKQRFSGGANSYEDGKFFATTQNDAAQWGDMLYPNGNYMILEAKFDSRILTARGTIYSSRLDGVGPAYYFSNMDTNIYMISIC